MFNIGSAKFRNNNIADTKEGCTCGDSRQYKDSVSEVQILIAKYPSAVHMHQLRSSNMFSRKFRYFVKEFNIPLGGLTKQ